MCMEKTPWEKSVEFHGHSCPGLAVGYRVAGLALRKLNEYRAADEELIAIVENDACGVDAIMLLTGCTLGKGNLIYRDHGKQVYTFGSRNSNRALRISVNGAVLHRQDPVAAGLRKKVFGGTATAEETKKYYDYQASRTDQILNMPEEDFCVAEEIAFKMPDKARIFNSVQCGSCGEYVMESRARVKDGQPVCIPCSDNYSRGW
ncbi:formylmethanofuran dehydrogenase, subunit E [Desulfotomaculum arcticum]|uniref:Formylmethanofuran dehydrogenase, subunit E n=1 Tax=Desulfotruncus arcticus DSM 17038 TaxID=1121424 RepID=A0A1I2SZK1_9FIRM|nr:FmdE family protein [Desulfotruncus arcticus]SFG58073.1 formylmethanofuran dehydrogenase, subunit E [Desulfotomaculum arcticum] [Desulfotruncus arcticus DSM 17038]